MSRRGEFTESYEDARRLLREHVLREEGNTYCPDCEMQQFDWTVTTVSETYSLNMQCEYCGRKDWMYFEKELPWSGNS